MTDEASRPPDLAPSDKTLVLPIVLAFFFGPLGLHRLWVGLFKSGGFMLGLSGLAFIAMSRHGALVQQIQAGDVPERVPSDLALASVILLITTIWATVDMVKMLAGKFRDAQEKPLKKWL